MQARNKPVNELMNIGTTVAKRLREIGVHTYDDLKEMGAAGAYMRISANHPEKNMPVCYYLYSLEGALNEQHWGALSKETKQTLLHQINRQN
ncbi:TfoX/Sxy family protein [Kordiimonas aquimaris]|uniref:TfoX/Sxy family protein n=1 Tax=Kordiimonas aquimaris TaxID=707591 RepID=UPI0021CF8EE6|nr:TfoX/Sxy family protein [Kordiimonas aquimaris]